MPRGARTTVNTGNGGTAGTSTGTTTPKRGRRTRGNKAGAGNIINWTTPQVMNALSSHIANDLNGFDTMPKGKELVHVLGLSVRSFIGAQSTRL